MYYEMMSVVYSTLRMDVAFDGIKILYQYPAEKSKAHYPCIVIEEANQSEQPAAIGNVIYSSSDTCYLGKMQTANFVITAIAGADLGAEYVADLIDKVVDRLLESNVFGTFEKSSITAGEIKYNSKNDTLSQSISAKYLGIVGKGEINLG